MVGRVLFRTGCFEDRRIGWLWSKKKSVCRDRKDELRQDDNRCCSTDGLSVGPVGQLPATPAKGRMATCARDGNETLSKDPRSCVVAVWIGTAFAAVTL